MERWQKKMLIETDPGERPGEEECVEGDVSGGGGLRMPGWDRRCDF